MIVAQKKLKLNVELDKNIWIERQAEGSEDNSA